MKVYSLSLLKYEGESEPVYLGFASDLSAFGYFQRSSVREMLSFITRTITKRTLPGQRQSIEHQGVHPRSFLPSFSQILRNHCPFLMTVLAFIKGKEEC